MKIMIGIPCYKDVSGETLTDYVRFAYHLGRRSEHEYVIAIKTKSEQFRARNDIVKGALQTACDYLFFIDDDHVIDWEDSSSETGAYDIVDKLVKHMEHDDELGIVGVLYFHRGAECKPVLLKEGKDGGFYWLRDDEVTGELQDVDIQGGGCFMLRMSMFDKIDEPYFDSESRLHMGTDMQICIEAKKHGYKVKCDTSIAIGHVESRRDVVTPLNRHRKAAENHRQYSGVVDAINPDYRARSAIQLYMMDALEYLDCDEKVISDMATEYLGKMDGFDAFFDKKDYYRNLGKLQLARQVVHHSSSEPMMEQLKYWNLCIDTNIDAYAADIGCGSAPVGFDFALRGHRMDFIDLDGSGAYEFTKWRVKKRGISDRCGFEFAGKYDYVLMLDVIEHLQELDCQEMLGEVSRRLKDNGVLFTNYFQNMDFNNKEHIMMDHEAVSVFLTTELGLFPKNISTWVKYDMGFMDRKKESIQ